MSAHETSNKATIRRLMDAMNTGDAELISQMVDEVFDPDVKQHSPFEATGTQALKEGVVARLYRAFPRPSHYDRGSDRRGRQGRREGYGHRDPPG